MQDAAREPTEPIISDIKAAYRCGRRYYGGLTVDHENR